MQTKQCKISVDLMNLIDHKNLCGVAVGDDIKQVHSIFGPSKSPAARLGQKSLYYHLYENLSFVSENDTIVAIDVAFNGSKATIVDFIYKYKNYEDWMSFFSENNWEIRDCSEAINACNNGVSICFFKQPGKLCMVSLS